MAEIIAPISRKQRDPIEEAQIERIGERLKAQRFERTPREVIGRRIRAAMAVAAACCLLIVGASLLWSKDDRRVESAAGPLLLGDGQRLTRLSVGEGRGARFTLSDGSSVDLADTAVLRVVENDSERFTLSLERGRATFDIPPNGRRRWVVDAGTARVTVLGTRFLVARAVDSVEIAVERGEVFVEGELVDGGRQLLTVGQRLRVVDQSMSERQEREDDHPAPEVAANEPPYQEAEVESEARWRPLARRGDFDEAFQLLGSDGVARETRQASVIDDLFLLADVARRSGHPREAVAPLEQIVIGHAADHRASVAAFTLGRLNINVLGNSVRARWAFERAIALGAPPALEEDAYALLVEACSRSGDQASARSSGREYLRRYPDGRLATSVRTWAGLDESR